uniref:Uncharacterized protein n=1 Tax=Leersia perrieri TaxID=77586 RepID=A0A0D9WVP0_9ORYZ
MLPLRAYLCRFTVWCVTLPLLPHKSRRCPRWPKGGTVSTSQQVAREPVLLTVMSTTNPQPYCNILEFSG